MRRGVLALLAALLLLQWGAAYGHCRALHALATGLPGWAVCTAHGTDPAPTAPNDALHADWDCPTCHHVPFVDAAPPPTIGPSGAAWVRAALPPVRQCCAALGPRAPPPPARAPPALA